MLCKSKILVLSFFLVTIFTLFFTSISGAVSDFSKEPLADSSNEFQKSYSKEPLGGYSKELQDRALASFENKNQFDKNNSTYEKWISETDLIEPPFKIEKAVVKIEEKIPPYRSLSVQMTRLFSLFIEKHENMFPVFKSIPKNKKQLFSAKVMKLFFSHFGLKSDNFETHIASYFDKKYLNEKRLSTEIELNLKSNPRACSRIKNLENFNLPIAQVKDEKMYAAAYEYALFKEFSANYKSLIMEMNQRINTDLSFLEENVPPEIKKSVTALIKARAKTIFLIALTAGVVSKDPNNWPLLERFNDSFVKDSKDIIDKAHNLDDSSLATWTENLRIYRQNSGQLKGILSFIQKCSNLFKSFKFFYIDTCMQLENSKKKILSKLNDRISAENTSLYEKGQARAALAAISKTGDELIGKMITQRLDDLGALLIKTENILKKALLLYKNEISDTETLINKRIQNIDRALNNLTKMVKFRRALRDRYYKSWYDLRDAASIVNETIVTTASSNEVKKAYDLYQECYEICIKCHSLFRDNTDSIKKLFMNPESVNFISDLDHYDLFTLKNPVFGKTGWHLSDFLTITDDIETSDIMSPIYFKLPEKIDIKSEKAMVERQYAAHTGITRKIEEKKVQKTSALKRKNAQKEILDNLIAEAFEIVSAARKMPIVEIGEEERDKIYNAFAMAERAYKKSDTPNPESAASFLNLLDEWKAFTMDWAPAVSPPVFKEAWLCGIDIMKLIREKIIVARDDLVENLAVVDLKIESGRYMPSYVKISLNNKRNYADATLIRKKGSASWWRFKFRPDIDGDYSLSAIAADSIGRKRELSYLEIPFSYDDSPSYLFFRNFLLDLEKNLEDGERFMFLEKFNRKEFIPNYEVFRRSLKEFMKRARNCNLKFINISPRIRKHRVEIKARWTQTYDLLPETAGSGLSQKISRTGITLIFLKRDPNFKIFDIKSLEGPLFTVP